LNPLSDARDHESPNLDFQGLKTRSSEILCQHEEGKSFTLKNGEMRLDMDFAYVIRTPAPRPGNKYVFIIIGGYTIGTHAAAYWVSQQKNLH
jgi:hypothetical protein